jgi:hypothetical protein
MTVEKVPTCTLGLRVMDIPKVKSLASLAKRSVTVRATEILPFRLKVLCGTTQVHEANMVPVIIRHEEVHIA